MVVSRHDARHTDANTEAQGPAYLFFFFFFLAGLNHAYCFTVMGK